MLKCASLIGLTLAGSAPAAVAELHMAHAMGDLSYPSKFVRVLKYMRCLGADTGMILPEYRDKHALGISERALKKLDSIAASLGQIVTGGISILYMMRQISKIPPDRQYDATKKIMRHTIYRDTFTLPSNDQMLALLAEFEDFGEDAVTFPPLESRAPAKAAPKTSNASIIVEVEDTDEKMATETSPICHAVSLKCTCGLEYVINLRNGRINAAVDWGTPLRHMEVDGNTVFGLPKDVVEHLDLELYPMIWPHMIDSGDSRYRHVLLTTMPISKKKLEEITRILADK